MLDANLKAQLATHLQRLQHPVELAASLDDTPASARLRELLREIAEASPLVSVVEARGGTSRAPSFTVGARGEPARVRFAGLPLGHEFTSLVLALLQAGGHPPKAADAVLKRIRELEGDHDFEIYVSLTCHNCPDVVQALNLMAIQNPRIRATMIDGALFQDEVRERQVMAVPAVFRNGAPFGQGRMGLADILARIDGAGRGREAAAVASKDPFDVLVVGGGPAGAAAAVYAARKGIRTGIASERFGGQVLDTLGIENFVSVKETEGPKFAHALEEHVRQYDVDIMEMQRAKALKPGELIEVELDSGASVKAKSVIVTTGARWRNVNVPGEQEYRNKGVAYCPHCDGPLFKGRRVAVIGGGNSGVEAAIDLAGLAAQVTLIEFDTKLRADAVLQKKLAALPNVTVLLNAQTTAITGDGHRVNGLAYKDRASGEERSIALEGVFVQIGLVPNTEWLRGTVELTGSGEIVVDARGRTSVPGVFAAGDATTVPFKQIIIAAGDGAKAALGAFDYLVRR